ncbi:hypothetical protein L873DRAFT_1747157 [Choiromyces venosus 120613-1]|uniref:Vacuolar ATPase assembly protein VMA22 n=1 Tax=Choiromyces venosus 120613-1 TaxID=1336337 RepID=A0A3N4JBF6_9PEZI|nr:hypothetical protein L873DRAFT_1747157 [Choiromyces venosus 120613-1]
MSDHLDQLYLTYLDTVDTYQSLRASLATHFSTGFLSLAQANYNSTSGGRRYGEDFYDERMTATRGVDVEDGVFECKLFELEKEEEEEEEEEEEGEEEKSEKSKEQTPAIDPRDPIRWFGILVPSALRQAQSEFTLSVQTIIPQLTTTISKLAMLSSEIESYHSHAGTKYLYKILTTAPPSPLPGAVELLPLDISDGFIHLCTATQTVGVIERFMPDSEKLWLLKIPYNKVEKDIKWESVTRREERGEEFPHMFAERLGSSEVEEMREVIRLEEKGWRESLEGVEWLE